MAKNSKIIQKDVSRIQSSTAKQYGGKIPKGHFIGRAQRTIANNKTTKGDK